MDGEEAVIPHKDALLYFNKESARQEELARKGKRSCSNVHYSCPLKFGKYKKDLLLPDEARQRAGKEQMLST